MTKAALVRLIIVACGLLVGLTSPAADSRAPRKKLVMLVSEPEYETARTLPVFATRHLQNDFRVVMVSGPFDGNDNAFDKISELVDADVLLVSVRRRTPPKAELDLIRRHIAAGRPVVGIRTASHAFAMNAKQKMSPGGADWPEWDAEILGGHYTGHYDSGPITTVKAADAAHPILEGVTLPFTSEATLYKTSPLQPGAHTLLTGTIEGQPAEPLAWTFTHRGGGRVFYTSLGHKTDLSNPSFARLLKNGIIWAASGPEKKP
jgi:type 1 glutamine amidotransferase